MQLIAICVVALVFGFMGSMPLAGPIAIMAVARASRGKYSEAMRIGLGAAVAEGIYAGLAFWGFTTFLARHAIVVPVSRAVTAIVLTAIGVALRRSGSPRRPEGRAGEQGGHGAPGLLGVGHQPDAPPHVERRGRGPLLEGPPGAVAGLRDPVRRSAPPRASAAGSSSSPPCSRGSAASSREAAITWVIRSMGLVLVVLALWSAVKLVHSFA